MENKSGALRDATFQLQHPEHQERKERKKEIRREVKQLKTSQSDLELQLVVAVDDLRLPFHSSVYLLSLSNVLVPTDQSCVWKGGVCIEPRPLAGVLRYEEARASLPLFPVADIFMQQERNRERERLMPKEKLCK